MTYWVDRTQWGERHRPSAALQILLAETAERPLYAEAASDSVGSLRVLEKLGSNALASAATSHQVAVGRSRKRSCASTEVGTELCGVVGRRVIRARPCHFGMAASARPLTASLRMSTGPLAASEENLMQHYLGRESHALREEGPVPRRSLASPGRTAESPNIAFLQGISEALDGLEPSTPSPTIRR